MLQTMAHRREQLSKARQRYGGGGMGRIVQLAFGLLTLAVAGSAEAQGNLDQGKAATELYASACAACHESPQSISRTKLFGLERFLRKHYTSSPESAAILADYLKAQDEVKEGVLRPPADIPNVVHPLTSQPTSAQYTQSIGLPSASSSPVRHAVTDSALRGSCGPDVQRLCAGLSKPDALKCLSSHRMDLSPTCDAFFKEMSVPRAAQKGAPKTTPAVTNGPPVTPTAANIAAPNVTLPPANSAADTLAPPPADEQAAARAAGDSPADKSAESAAAPPADNSGANAVEPPAANRPSVTSGSPEGKSPPAKGALAFPL